MKQTTIRILAAAALMILPLWGGQMLAQTEEQIDRFNKEREAFFNKKLELTDTEATKFWPLYNDFHHRKTRIHEDEMNTHRYVQNNIENLSEKEIIETLDKIGVLETERFELDQEYYHKKFPEILPPKKVLMLYRVEWEFRRYLIRELRGHDGRGGRQGKGRPGGSGPVAPPPMD